MWNKKYQGGGGILPVVSAVQAPRPAQPAPLNFQGFNTAVDAQLRLINTAMRVEQQRMLQERTEEARQNAVLDLQGSMGLTVHNEGQQKELDNIFKQYRITDADMAAVDWDNEFQVKDLERRFKQATTSQEFLRLRGEVELGNKLRDSALQNLDNEEFLQWSERWNNYTSITEPGMRFDIKELAPAVYKGTSGAKVDFSGELDSVASAFAGADLEDENVQRAINDAVRFTMQAKDVQQAVERGFLQEDENGNLIPTEAAQNIIRQRIKAATPDEDLSSGFSGDVGAIIENEAIVRGIEPGTPEYAQLALDIYKQEQEAKTAREARLRAISASRGSGGGAPKEDKPETTYERLRRQYGMLGIDVDAIDSTIREVSGNSNDARKRRVGVLKENLQLSDIKTFAQLNELLSLLDNAGFGVSQYEPETLLNDPEAIFEIEAVLNEAFGSEEEIDMTGNVVREAETIDIGEFQAMMQSVFADLGTAESPFIQGGGNNQQTPQRQQPTQPQQQPEQPQQQSKQPVIDANQFRR